MYSDQVHVGAVTEDTGYSIGRFLNDGIQVMRIRVHKKSPISQIFFSMGFISSVM